MTEFTDNPNDLIVQRFKQRGSAPRCFTLSWEHEQYYLEGSPSITLFAVCYVDDDSWLCAITDENETFARVVDESQASGENPFARFTAIANKLTLPTLDLTAPLPLETVVVPKPWGREIWYTGIEARGICRVNGTPIPWLISMAAELIAGDEQYRDPILLKILDPLPDAVYGDLYFELHEAKTEVYVVTHIDKNAWPDGIGRIRYGFNEDVMSRYETEADFRQSYLDSVNAYRDIRTQIDEQLDQYRTDEGFSSDDIIPPAILEAWKARLNPELNRREHECREAMNAFTASHPLKVGDVVQVEPLTPHALQHGVRVVEFQTPHYERYILSFAQKVLTQSGWDTETAMSKARLSANIHRDLTLVSEEPGQHRVDIIADFEQFQVHRVSLAPHANWSLPSTGSYLIVAGVSGMNQLAETTLAGEQACYIPATSKPLSIDNKSDTSSIALVGLPKRHALNSGGSS